MDNDRSHSGTLLSIVRTRISQDFTIWNIRTITQYLLNAFDYDKQFILVGLSSQLKKTSSTDATAPFFIAE